MKKKIKNTGKINKFKTNNIAAPYIFLKRANWFFKLLLDLLKKSVPIVCSVKHHIRAGPEAFLPFAASFVLRIPHPPPHDYIAQR